MNISSRNISYMIWVTMVLAMGLLYACPETDSSGDDTPIPTPIPTPTLTAKDIAYNYHRLAQGTAGALTPSSSTINDFSGLTFSIASITPYVGDGTPEPPTVSSDGIITSTDTTSAGSYRVTITPDDSTILGDPITVDFYVIVKPEDIAHLDKKLAQAIIDYGLTGDFNYIDTSAVTTMSWLFSSGSTPGTGENTGRTYVRRFNGDISKWNVSAVKDFSYMFRGAKVFNQDIGRWNVSAGEDFSNMFRYAEVFNQDIGRWNVSAGKNFSGMFSSAFEFNQDIGDWVVSAGTNFSDMFEEASDFNQDIGRWNVSAGKNFRSMFQYAIVFNQDIGDWVVSAGEDFGSMFYQAQVFNQDIGRWNVSAGKNFSGMFSLAFKFNQDIGDWVVSAGTDFSDMFDAYVLGNLWPNVFNQDISGWDVSSGTNFSQMFQGATAFTQDISKWEVSPTATKDDMFTNSGVSSLPSWYQQTP